MANQERKSFGVKRLRGALVNVCQRAKLRLSKKARPEDVPAPVQDVWPQPMPHASLGGQEASTTVSRYRQASSKFATWFVSHSNATPDKSSQQADNSLAAEAICDSTASTVTDVQEKQLAEPVTACAKENPSLRSVAEAAPHNGRKSTNDSGVDDHTRNLDTRIENEESVEACEDLNGKQNEGLIESDDEEEPEENPLDAFEEVIAALDLGKLRQAALSLRRQGSDNNGNDVDCRLHEHPKCGSYNVVYIIEFSDGIKWCARVPGYGKRPYPTLREKMDLEYNTLKYLKRYTTVPVPEIYYWTTDPTEIGAAFGLIEHVAGSPLLELWYEKEHFGEEKRRKALWSIAQEMQKLYLLQFEAPGMLRYNPSNPHIHPSIRPTMDYYDNGVCHWAGVRQPDQVEARVDRWLETRIKQLNRDSPESFGYSANGPLKVFAKSVPNHMHHVPLSVSLADLDLQNVFVDPSTGEVTGFIDFDGIAVRPVNVGAAAYPMWLARDLDPSKYCYYPGAPYEDSPEQLAAYRTFYVDCWANFATSKPFRYYDTRWTSQSHVMCTIWNALVDYEARESLVIGLLDHAYATAYDLDADERSKMWDHCWHDFEPWSLRCAIGKGLWQQRAKRATLVTKFWHCKAVSLHIARRPKDYWTAACALCGH